MAKLYTVEYGPRLYETRAGSEKVMLPSCTEVLRVTEGNWMNAWLQKVGRREVDRVMGEAAALGTRIHAVAERLAWDRGAEVEPEMEPYASAIREFLDTHVRRVIGTEMSFASAEMRFGGTCDLVAELTDGSVGVIDWKSTSGGVTKIHKLQTAGYALLLREGGYEINKRVVVRLHKAEEKQGQWYARAALDHRGDVEAFMAAVALWHFLHSSKLKGTKGEAS